MTNGFWDERVNGTQKAAALGMRKRTRNSQQWNWPPPRRAAPKDPGRAPPLVPARAYTYM